MKIEKLTEKDLLLEDVEVQGCMGCTTTVWSGATSFAAGCTKVTVYNTGSMWGSLF